MSRYVSREFLNLQAEWYAKLKAEGFQDVEDYSQKYGNFINPYITRSCKDLAKKYNTEIFQHYQYCREFLNNWEFASSNDRRMWAMYTDGESLRTIATRMQRYGVHKSYFWVYEQLKRLRTDLKTYLAEQELENEDGQ